MINKALQIVSLIFLVLMVSCSDPEVEEKMTSNEMPENTGIAPSPRINFLNQQIRENPNDAELYYLRSKEYYDLRKFGEALFDINRAIERDSLQSDFFLKQGKIYFENYDITRSMNSLRRAHELKSDRDDALYFMGKYMYYYSQYDEAMGFANSALRLDIFNPDVYFLKAMIFKETGETNKAISNFQTAVEQDPEFYNAYVQLGIIFSEKQDPLAIRYFKNALRVDPKSTESLYGIALFYQSLEDFEKAMDYYEQIIEIDSRHERAYYNKGFIYFQQDSLEKADRHFGIAINISPTFADAYYMRGLCAEAENDIVTAEFYYRQALRLGEHSLSARGLDRIGK